MFRPRVIPVLLLKGQGLVKSFRFRDYKYIGDPINAVKLFNDLGADELAFLDILATKENRHVSVDFVKSVGDEANMPFSVGGGIRSVGEIRDILKAGAEKVIVNTAAATNPEFIREAVSEYGSSTIAVSIDVKKTFLGKQLTWINSGTQKTGYSPVEFAQLVEDMGAGELIINSIDNDGLMQGYDIPLIKMISEAVRIPVVALGGAGSEADLRKAVEDGYASAVAAGSMFVFHGPRRAVLVNYPDQDSLNRLFSNIS